jgi:hypothetical protein
MTALLLFAATFGTVLTLGIQQLNVQGNHRLLAAITALAIGSCQLALYKVLPGPTEPLEIAAFLAGGPTGILTAMALHPRLVRWFNGE